VTARELERARRLLCRLQDDIQSALLAARAKQARRFARVAAVTAADTIYHVDRLSERAILGWFKEHWPRRWPVEVVMEGLEERGTVTFPRNTPVEQTVFKCILDPVDGTRNLMHDKRSAWILSALAPQRGANTNLADIFVAAMTEVPTTKQSCADQVSAVRGRGLVTTRRDLVRDQTRRIMLRPSPARNFDHSFASFVRFFPEGKALMAEAEEALWHRLGVVRRGAELVFEDQYITTGGQIYELLAGHDRMIADLRPLALRKLGIDSALSCHPYDICTALLLEEAGGVVESPESGPLRAPLDTTTPVSWIAYANPHLARLVRPALRRVVGGYFV
jgi:fructose-1,6-bisphosphatase/inositol monophosphatase family enzyme